MNCSECHRVLPESLEGQRNAELEAHLTSCVACSELVEDLNVIARQASALREADEPSPRVWNMIEAELRREGVIHPPQPRRSWLPAFGSGWRPVAWLAPVAAALIAGAAFLLNPRPTTNSDQAKQVIESPAVVATGGKIPAKRPAAEDQQILDAVALQAPMMKASYEANLNSVNAYIRDAELSVQQDPYDQEARQYLMEAYEQKAMLYDMALNRSLR
jgi:hypothetical protein